MRTTCCSSHARIADVGIQRLLFWARRPTRQNIPSQVSCAAWLSHVFEDVEMKTFKLVLESLGFKRFVATPTGTCAQIGLLDRQAAWVHTPNDSVGIPVSSILAPESIVQFHNA